MVLFVTSQWLGYQEGFNYLQSRFEKQVPWEASSIFAWEYGILNQVDDVLWEPTRTQKKYNTEFALGMKGEYQASKCLEKARIENADKVKYA